MCVVFYGCENWCLTWRVERRLRMFENRVRTKILGPEGDGVTGNWRRIHIEELNDLYCSPNFRMIKSRRMSWAVHVALTAGRRGTTRGFGGET